MLSNDSDQPGGGPRPAAPPGNWVAALRSIAGPASIEHCDLCGARLEARHPHLMEPRAERLLCACTPCALLFGDRPASNYRRVPDEVARLPDFRLEPAQWEALRIPINMVFFLRSSAQKRWLAIYPGPAGSTESQLDLSAWDELVRVNPALAQLEEDVEAVLVNRLNGADECLRVPIDRCYALTGLIRRNWRGIAGGSEAERAVQEFLTALRSEAAPAEASHA